MHFSVAIRTALLHKYNAFWHALFTCRVAFIFVTELNVHKLAMCDKLASQLQLVGSVDVIRFNIVGSMDELRD